MPRKKSSFQPGSRPWFSTIRWILLALIPARFALLSFTGENTSGWPMTVLGALLLGGGLSRLFHLREEHMLQTQYLHLLGYLSTRLAAGAPLEAAFMESAGPLAEQLGRHNRIVHSLSRLQNNLEAQMSLNEALLAFMREVRLSACQRDFTILIMLARTGGRTDIFIRQSHHDLTAQINAQSQVANERRGHSSEALILALIPFFMARFILGKASTYSQSIPESPWLSVFLGILYLTAMLALFVLLLLLAPEKTSLKKNRRKKRKAVREEVHPTPASVPWLSRFYLDFLPGQIGLSVSSAVHLLAADRQGAWARYMTQKRLDIALGFIPAILLAASGRVSWFLVLLVPFLFSSLRDLMTTTKAAKLKEQYRFFYPSVVNSLAILMESGLTLDRSLRTMARVSLSGPHAGNPVAAVLGQAALLLEAGYDSVMAANLLAENCPLPEVQAAIRLMARYEREGGLEILELIRMQADRSRQLYRDALRGRAEQRSLLFVLPMAMDLLVVMATVVLPALVSMQQLYL